MEGSGKKKRGYIKAAQRRPSSSNRPITGTTERDGTPFLQESRNVEPNKMMLAPGLGGG